MYYLLAGENDGSDSETGAAEDLGPAMNDYDMDVPFSQHALDPFELAKQGHLSPLGAEPRQHALVHDEVTETVKLGLIRIADH